MKTLLLFAALFLRGRSPGHQCGHHHQNILAERRSAGEPHDGNSLGRPRIYWWNQEADGGGVENNFLPEEVFIVGGNTITSYAGFTFAGNGSVGGYFYLASIGTTTLTGNPSIITSYAGWDPAVAATLENKAITGATVDMIDGSPSFALTFQAIPEPSVSALLLGVGSPAFAMARKRLRKA
ncbi:MAG: PEP-CTERM sorting domain-containing protein [Verrucomicrobiae bacterium]|nr:PEP-CTERM sorting domain-containing protein [Verrucomicrobiae bacterium]